MAAVRPVFHFQQPVSGKPLVGVLGVASVTCFGAVVLLISAPPVDIGALIFWGTVALAASTAFLHHFNQFRSGAKQKFEITDCTILWSDSSLANGFRTVPLQEVVSIREEIDDADSIFVLELQSSENVRLPKWLTFYPKDRARFAAFLGSGGIKVPVQFWQPKR